MKQAIKEYQDIERLKNALTITTSPALKRDYTKAITRKTKELKDYCNFRGIDYRRLNRNV